MRKSIFILVLLGIFSSCSKNMIPNYTTVQEIFGLQKGMSMNRVNSTLGVGPYEFYTNFYDGNKVLVYKYKKQFQKVRKKVQYNRDYLAGRGDERFKEEGDIYVVFDQKTDAMVYYITSTGREMAKKRIYESNQLKLIKGDPIAYLKMHPELYKPQSKKVLKRKGHTTASLNVKQIFKPWWFPGSAQASASISASSALTSTSDSKSSANESFISSGPVIVEKEVKVKSFSEEQEESTKEKAEVKKEPVWEEKKEQPVKNEYPVSTPNESAKSTESITPKETPVSKSPTIQGKLASGMSLMVCAAVTKESDARSLAAKLRSEGFDAGYLWIPDYEPEGKKLYRVYVGPFSTSDEALDQLPSLKPFYSGAYFYQIK